VFIITHRRKIAGLTITITIKGVIKMNQDKKTQVIAKIQDKLASDLAYSKWDQGAIDSYNNGNKLSVKTGRFEKEIEYFISTPTAKYELMKSLESSELITRILKKLSEDDLIDLLID